MLSAFFLLLAFDEALDEALDLLDALLDTVLCISYLPLLDFMFRKVRLSSSSVL